LPVSPASILKKKCIFSASGHDFAQATSLSAFADEKGRKLHNRSIGDLVAHVEIAKRLWPNRDGLSLGHAMRHILQLALTNFSNQSVALVASPAKVTHPKSVAKCLLTCFGNPKRTYTQSNFLKCRQTKQPPRPRPPSAHHWIYPSALPAIDWK
jgi:hypothetical protein